MAENLEVFNKDVLVKQIKTAEDIVKQSQEQLVKLQGQIQQQVGILAFARHLLNNYSFEVRVNESKES